MKKTALIITGTLLIAFIGGVVFYKTNSVKKDRLTVQSIGDNAIFVGDKKRARSFQESTVSPEAHKRFEDHQRDLKAVDDAWNNIGIGNSYFKKAEYESAATAYEKAYSIGGGIKHVSGFDLAKTYEKLNRYDDAITILDNMIKNRETNEYGIQKASEMKARLLAAKNAAVTQSNNG